MGVKTFLGLSDSLHLFYLAAAVILPVWSHSVELVTNPDSPFFSLPSGKLFNITCQGSGDDKRLFTAMYWRWFNAEGEYVNESTPVTSEEDYSSTLVFTDPIVEDSGYYRCYAVYDKHEKLVKTVSITFYSDKPTFQKDFENVTACENSYLDILCEATGESPINYEWYNQNQDKITENGNSPIFALNFGNGSVLVIPEVSLNDEGIYTCLARNQHGLSSKTYELRVLPSCGNVTTNGTSYIRDVGIVSITSNSVKFIFNVTGSPTYIQASYNESREAVQYNETWKFGHNYEAKGLIPGGLYNFRFRAIPSDSDDWTEDYQVILLPDQPEVIFQNIGSGSIKLMWNRKFDDIMRETVDRFELSYFSVLNEKGTHWVPNSCPIIITIPRCSYKSSYTISGLSNNVYYQIQLRAHTASGYGESFVQKIFM